MVRLKIKKTNELLLIFKTDLVIRQAINGTAHPWTKGRRDWAIFVTAVFVSMADTYPLAPAQKLLPLFLARRRRDGARPRRRRRPPPLLSLRALLLRHRSSHPERSP